jgi:acetyltransferase
VSIRNLEKIFKPRRVVLIGVDKDPEDLGRLVLSNLLGSGFRGIVYPVSITVESVSGVPTYRISPACPRRRTWR